MISSEEISGYYSAFYAITLIASFVLAILICVCNPKSKTFHKHKSFILSHDLPNEVPLTSADLNHAQQCSLPNHFSDGETEPGNKLKAISLNRALPDIPQVAGTSLVNTPFSNSTSFADVNSNDDVDSLYTVANTNVATSSNNHPYARIRNNLLVDSSTENDTDDYSESRLPTVAAAPGRCNDNSQFRASIHEPNDTYELEPQPHILRLQIRNNNIEPPLFNDEEEKKEISYNTISVREPLSKVLAERENFEHHYNEVEDERISSFYEEITTGSATYSKINEINQTDKSGYEDAMPSTSRQLSEDILNSASQVNAPLEVDGPLYSLVDKKMKRANNTQANAATASPLSNNLYTKVIKSPATSAKKLNDPMPILQRYSPPPPLPPPLNRDSHIKLNRNTIMFGTPSSSNSPPQNYNSSFEDASQNFYHKVSRVNSERDPGYETVYKMVEPCDNQIDPNQNDYGYEAIAIDESDPAYEIVKPDNGYEIIKNEKYNNSQEEQADPNYEIIPSSREFVNNAKVTFSSPESSAHVSQPREPIIVNGRIIDEAVIIEHL